MDEWSGRTGESARASGGPHEVVVAVRKQPTAG
jgi:hypothetical protein